MDNTGNSIVVYITKKPQNEAHQKNQQMITEANWSRKSKSNIVLKTADEDSTKLWEFWQVQVISESADLLWEVNYISKQQQHHSILQNAHTWSTWSCLTVLHCVSKKRPNFEMV